MGQMVLQMTQREIDRAKVFHQVIQGKLTQVKAGELLDLSREHVNRLCRKVKNKGDRALIHGLRSKPSNNRIAQQLRNKIINTIKMKYHDFGPTFASEKLLLEGIQASVETVRKIMISGGIWQSRKRKAKHREWRERRSCFGEMVQMDGSQHAWFETRRPKCVLLAAIDDATNRITLKFTHSESTRELLIFTRSYMETFGRPVSFYVDRDSIFKTSRQPNLEEELNGHLALTQFSRIMEKCLSTKVIKAYSPQAKGRVERLFKTLQDRLVKELRLAGISSTERANEFLEDHYVEAHNERFSFKPKSSFNAHRPLNRSKQELDAIFSILEERTLTNDYTVRWRSRIFQVLKHQPAFLLPRTKLTIEERLDGSIRIRHKNSYLKFSEIDPSAIRKPVKLVPKIRKPRIVIPPPKNHPWRDFERSRIIYSIRKEYGLRCIP
jgi:hypothetical protein